MNTFTYDVSTDIGKVRLHIQDWDISQITGSRSTWSCIFADEEIQAFLNDFNGSVYMAACQALHSIANSKALLSIRKRIGDYDEDLTNISIQLRQQAKELQDLAKAEAEVPADAFAEMAVDDFTAREIIANKAAREL